MSSTQDPDAEDLKPTFAQGYKLGEKKTVDEYAKLDEGDESLARWKASLGITPDAASGAADGPKVVILTLDFQSETLPQKITFDLSNEALVKELDKNPITIKEGVEYTVGCTFKVNRDVISGLRYMHVVKRKGIKVDKMDQMIGSFGPHPKGEAYSKTFPAEEAPSGIIARGTYNVRSRFTDDDGVVYSEFLWSFKISKEW